MEINFDKYNKIYDKTFFKRLGKVVNVVGLTIESNGPDAKLDDEIRVEVTTKHLSKISDIRCLSR